MQETEQAIFQFDADYNRKAWSGQKREVEALWRSSTRTKAKITSPLATGRCGWYNKKTTHELELIHKIPK